MKRSERKTFLTEAPSMIHRKGSNKGLTSMESYLSFSFLSFLFSTQKIIKGKPD